MKIVDKIINNQERSPKELMNQSMKEENALPVRRAWGYLRRSTDRQKQSIEDQRREVEKYAKKEGCELVDVPGLPPEIFKDGCFVDDAISGATTDYRRAFKVMIEFACQKSHPVDVILVWNISLFGRYDPDEGGYYRHLLKRNRVEIIYISEGLIGDDTDELIIPVKQWQAREYLKQLSRDIIRGKLSRAEKGGSNGQKAPYAYDRVLMDGNDKPYMIIRTLTNGNKEVYGISGNRLRIVPKGENIAKGDKDWVSFVPGDPAKIEVVENIYQWFVLGYNGREMGYKAIAYKLNEEGIPSPTGNCWAAGTIRAILNNPFYCGTYRYNLTSQGKFYKIKQTQACQLSPCVTEERKRQNNPKEDWIVVGNNHLGIISKELFLKAKQKSQATKKGKKYSNNIVIKGEADISSYLLSSLIKCAKCRHSFQGHRKIKKNKIYYYYVCGGYRTKGVSTCNKYCIRADVIENYILNETRKEFFKYVSSEQLKSALIEELGMNFPDTSAELKQIESQFIENERKVDMLLEAIDPRHKDILNKKLDELKQEREFLEQRKEELVTEKNYNIDFDEETEKIMEYLKNAE